MTTSIKSDCFKSQRDWFKSVPNKSGINEQLSDSTTSVIRKGVTAFQLDDHELHPEGIAFSHKHNCFFVSSVRKGIILKIDSTGSPSLFAQPEPRQSIMGLQSDDKNGVLWACAVSAPHLQHNAKPEPAALLKIDQVTGTVIKRYESPNTNHWLGDLTIASNGEVFVSNSSPNSPSVYYLDQHNETLRILFESTDLISVQGLALNRDETRLFISDYGKGLYVYDFSSGKIIQLVNKTTYQMKGIDGLYFYNDHLLAIQNGIKPFAIIQLSLDKNEAHIVSFEYLEMGLPEMNEPTLGVCKESNFYYIANSPWSAYSKENELLAAKIKNPIIRKINLQ